MTRQLDFETARDNGGDSWERADPRHATMARLRWDQWGVYLPGGEDAHIVTLRQEGHSYVGECDCKGDKFSSGPCAHLCTLRKAGFLGVKDVTGQSVELADEIDAVDNKIEKAVGDGGREERRYCTLARPGKRQNADQVTWPLGMQLYLPKKWASDDETISEDDDDQERDVRAWFCWEPDEASLEELVPWAQLRWTVERFHQDIKQELGADEYQGRTWTGFHHHCQLVMVAHAFVASQRLQTGVNRTRLASFETVVRVIVCDSAITR